VVAAAVPKADVAGEAAAAAAEVEVEEVEIGPPPTRFPPLLMMFDLANTLVNADAAFEDEVIPRIMIVVMNTSNNGIATKMLEALLLLLGWCLRWV